MSQIIQLTKDFVQMRICFRTHSYSPLKYVTGSIAPLPPFSQLRKLPPVDKSVVWITAPLTEVIFVYILSKSFGP
jgi:hypothetical protein